MQSQQTLKRHAILVDRMAGHMGIDLEEAALRGRITISGIEDAVLRCTGCAQADACESALDTKSAPQGKTPSFCRNADLFDKLKP